MDKTSGAYGFAGVVAHRVRLSAMSCYIGLLPSARMGEGNPAIVCALKWNSWDEGRSASNVEAAIDCHSSI